MNDFPKGFAGGKSLDSLARVRRLQVCVARDHREGPPATNSLIVRRSTPAMPSRDALIRKLARMAAREDDSTADDQ
jgi:hypothetical protein